MKLCKACGKQFYPPLSPFGRQSRRIVCSSQCRGKLYSGEKAHMFGKKHSQESKLKMSQSRAGRQISPESRKKISLSHKGRHLSLEHRMKISMSRQNINVVEWSGFKPIKKTKPRPHRTQQELLERKRFRNQRYKASKRKAEGSHTFKEWENLKKLYLNMCLCCKQKEPTIKLTEDHIIPLSMGGTDFITNIQPLCVSCNTRKHAKYIDYRGQGSNQLPNYDQKGA